MRPHLSVPLNADEASALEGAFQKFSGGKITVTKKQFIMYLIQYWMSSTVGPHPGAGGTQDELQRQLDATQQEKVELQGELQRLKDENTSLSQKLESNVDSSSKFDELQGELQRQKDATQQQLDALQGELQTHIDEELRLKQLIESSFLVNASIPEMQEVNAALQRRIAAGKSKDLADFIYQIFIFTRSKTNKDSLLS